MLVYITMTSIPILVVSPFLLPADEGARIVSTRSLSAQSEGKLQGVFHADGAASREIRYSEERDTAECHSIERIISQKI
jgi:hypothetical protein